jgi:hypothetical protein
LNQGITWETNITNPAIADSTGIRATIDGISAGFANLLAAVFVNLPVTVIVNAIATDLSRITAASTTFPSLECKQNSSYEIIGSAPLSANGGRVLATNPELFSPENSYATLIFRGAFLSLDPSNEDHRQKGDNLKAKHHCI